VRLSRRFASVGKGAAVVGVRSAIYCVVAALLVCTVSAGSAANGRVAAQDCDHALSACSALLAEQQAAVANQAQLAGIDQQIAYTTGAIAALTRVVADLQQRVSAQQAAVEATAARLDDLGRQVRYTQADLERRQAELTIRQELLYHRVRELDKVGGISYLQLVVTSRTFTELVNRVATIQRVSAGDEELVGQLKAGRAQVQKLRNQLRDDQARQQSLLARQHQQLAQLQREQEAERQAYAAQAALEAQLQARRQDVQAQQSAIGAQLQALQADYQRQLSELQARQLGGSGAGGTFGIDTDLRIVPGVDPGALNAYFNGTALAGQGAAFVNAGRQYGVNSLYLVAHAIEESAFGASEMAQTKNNLFGIAAYDSNPGAALSFPSFAACIDYEARFVRRDYLDPRGAFYHGPTLRGMNVNYATDGRWASNIAAIYLTLPGGLNPV
jgi:peptidoglycan hydrolase CwlO-like protein